MTTSPMDEPGDDRFPRMRGLASRSDLLRWLEAQAEAERRLLAQDLVNIRSKENPDRPSWAALSEVTGYSQQRLFQMRAELVPPTSPTDEVE